MNWLGLFIALAMTTTIISIISGVSIGIISGNYPGVSSSRGATKYPRIILFISLPVGIISWCIVGAMS